MNSRSILKLFPMLLLLSCAQAVTAGTLEPVGDGAQKREFELKDLENEIHTLSGYEGKVVLVNFWASWCISCIREFPSLERLRQNMGGRRFVLLAVNVREGKGTVQRFKKLQDAGIMMLMDKDGSVANTWDVEVYPTSFIIDVNGVVRRKIVGETDWDSEEMHGYIESLVSMGAAE